MTPKRQLNIRTSPATAEKIAALVLLYGTQAEVIAVAVDRLYTSEYPNSQRPPDVAAVAPAKDLARQIAAPVPQPRCVPE